MGYRLKSLDEPVFVAVPKPMLTEFGILYRLESCVPQTFFVTKLVIFLSFFKFEGGCLRDVEFFLEF